uniref:Uncharacterized protein n=1 Tax=Populus trichocarpa TaxID=3694 RepID=A9PAL6_POPTR|nr:unknown [Populus trichocarpa]
MTLETSHHHIYVQITVSRNLKSNHGILYLEVGRLLLLLDMGYHWKTSFLSHLMASVTSTSASAVLLQRLLWTS